MDLTATHTWLLGLVGGTVVDHDEVPLGRLDAILVDRQTGSPTWLVVRPAATEATLRALPQEVLHVRGETITSPVAEAAVLRAPALRSAHRLHAPVELQLHAAYALPLGVRAQCLDPEEQRATSSRLVAPTEWAPGPRAVTPVRPSEAVAPPAPSALPRAGRRHADRLAMEDLRRPWAAPRTRSLETRNSR